ncbi:MAG: clostripain-related cysteine peptidase, partial [Pyrinomonadaceae bacterium]
TKSGSGKPPNAWTVMFFFASDNVLAPITVAQIKAIKDAGFQKDSEVLVYFDCNDQGAPTRIFNSSFDEKQRARRRLKKGEELKSKIGDNNDPFVRDMIADIIDPEAIDIEGKPNSEKMRDALAGNTDNINATDALRNFLGFSRENHPAEHYALFLVGHGLVVGNDFFLPDEHPVSGISLDDMGTILGDFTDNLDGGTFELLAMHSCSMSALEVAYQFKGTAKYMMSSEGPSFIGGWPYRQLLKRIFNGIDKPEGLDDVEEKRLPALIRKLYFLTILNAADYMLAGYSLDLALCDLASDNFVAFKKPIEDLVSALRHGLRDKRIREQIILAHVESQSYWNEQYTDLRDFCACLFRRLHGIDPLQGACFEVAAMLRPNRDDAGAMVLRSDNFGGLYQHSHGLSVFFPWVRPFEFRALVPRKPGKNPPSPTDVSSIMGRYRDYAINKDLEKGFSWADFLEDYFAVTMRPLSGSDQPMVVPEAEDHDDDGGELDDPTPVVKPVPDLGGPVKPVPDLGGLEIEKPVPDLGGPDFIKPVVDLGGPEFVKPVPDLGGPEFEKSIPDLGGPKPIPDLGGGVAGAGIKNFAPNFIEIIGQHGRKRVFQISRGLLFAFGRHRRKRNPDRR